MILIITIISISINISKQNITNNPLNAFLKLYKVCYIHLLTITKTYALQ